MLASKVVKIDSKIIIYFTYFSSVTHAQKRGKELSAKSIFNFFAQCAKDCYFDCYLGQICLFQFVEQKNLNFHQLCGSLNLKFSNKV